MPVQFVSKLREDDLIAASACAVINADSFSQIVKNTAEFSAFTISAGRKCVKRGETLRINPLRKETTRAEQ